MEEKSVNKLDFIPAKYI